MYAAYGQARSSGFTFTKRVTAVRPMAWRPGEHFNPTDKPHGHYRVAERHAGDLINLQSDAEGMAVYAFETNLLSVTAGPTSVVGRTIIIHAEPDDYRTQPAGNSGARDRVRIDTRGLAG